MDDPLLAFQGLLAFHGGLLFIFLSLHHFLTGKSFSDQEQKSLAIGNPATLLGFFVLLICNVVSPAWVDFTVFQLSLSATYVLTSVILRARAVLRNQVQTDTIMER